MEVGGAHDEANAQFKIVSAGSAGQAEEDATNEGRREERTHAKGDDVEARQVDHGRGEQGHHLAEEAGEASALESRAVDSRSMMSVAPRNPAFW